LVEGAVLANQTSRNKLGKIGVGERHEKGSRSECIWGEGIGGEWKLADPSPVLKELNDNKISLLIYPHLQWKDFVDGTVLWRINHA